MYCHDRRPAQAHICDLPCICDALWRAQTLADQQAVAQRQGCSAWRADVTVLTPGVHSSEYTIMASGRQSFEPKVTVSTIMMPCTGEGK